MDARLGENRALFSVDRRLEAEFSRLIFHDGRLSFHFPSSLPAKTEQEVEIILPQFSKVTVADFFHKLVC
jgi:hypothetical protein